VVLLACSVVPRAAADLWLTVASTNNSAGLYSFTLSHGESPEVWGVTGGGSYILTQFHGIQQVYPPAGWSATVDTNEVITWQPTNGLVYLSVPVTFAVQSVFAVPHTYSDAFSSSDPYSQGYVTGGLYDPPSTTPDFTGLDYFSYVGPDTNSGPILSIQLVGTNAIVSWPKAIAGFTLQSGPKLIGTNWSNVASPQMTVGNFIYVTNGLAATPTFFRAKR
jgi:hypothetical protein